MGTNNLLRKAAFCLFSLAFFPASSWAEVPAKPDPLKLNGLYTVEWSGIPIGRILIEAEETDTTYSMSINTKTKGIAALLSDEATIMAAKGKKDGADSFIPQEYISRPQKGHDDDTITLAYDEKGHFVKGTDDKPDDPAWRAPVPNNEIDTARDPLTATLMLRRMLHASLGSGKTEITTRMYDGERLALLHLTRGPDSRVSLGKTIVNCVSVEVKREPILGFTPKELKKYRKSDPEIHIYFSNDQAFLPVRGTAKLPYGELSMTLTERR